MNLTAAFSPRISQLFSIRSGMLTENQELRFLIPENPQVTNARMQMLKAASLVIRSELNVLSIRALDKI